MNGVSLIESDQKNLEVPKILQHKCVIGWKIEERKRKESGRKDKG